MKDLFQKTWKNEIKNEIDAIRKWEEKMRRKHLKYKTIKYLHDFQQFETIRSINTGKTNIDEAEMDQNNPLENMVKVNNRSKPKTKEGKAKNKILLIV